MDKNKLNEIKAVLSMAIDGDYTNRISTDGENDFAELSQIVNEVLENFESTVNYKDTKYQNLIKKININLDIIEQVAGGDLRNFVDIDSDDEMAMVSQGINLMITNLRDIIKKIQVVMNDISVLITEIASAANEVKNNSEKQKNRTSNALEEINNIFYSIKEANKTASLVSNTAKENTSSVKKGTEYAEKVIMNIKNLQNVIKEASFKLKEVKENSTEIGDILKTIYTITDKSDLLALNATIEAAKAGESGRGFSVVASEIRKLADRSAKSSQEIESILKGIQTGITESVDSIDKGVDEVNSSVSLTRKNERVLDNVFTAFSKTTKLMADVSSSLNVQTKGVTSLNKSIEVISNVATEFASGALQTNQALHNLSLLMEDLNTRFEIFKIEE